MAQAGGSTACCHWVRTERLVHTLRVRGAEAGIIVEAGPLGVHWELLRRFNMLPGLTLRIHRGGRPLFLLGLLRRLLETL